MSLRARVLVGMVVIAVVLGIASVAITRSLEARLLGNVDQELLESIPRARAIVSQLAAAGQLEQLVESDGFSPDGSRQVDGPELSTLYLGVILEPGTVSTLVPPSVVEGTPEPVVDADEAVAAAESDSAFTVGSEDSDLRYRVRAHEIAPDLVVVVALPLDDVDAAVERLVAVEIAATLAVLAVVGLVGWWVIHLGVRPLKQMTVTASAIARGGLSHRVPEASPETEAGQLGIALNRMLARIERAFDERTRSEERLRQFLADASHELRTPVTTIQGYAELYWTGALDEPGDLDEAMRRTGQEAERMGTLVGDMLLLARLDQGRPLEPESVDLAALVGDAARDARAVDRQRIITVAVPGADAGPPLVVSGDGDRLRQVLANLVGNALVHTPADCPVALRARAVDGRAVVEVADQGPGMAPEVVEHAFERFYRAEPSRSRQRGGSGLGLSIVHAIVTAHGGEVMLTSVPGVGTTARIELPLADLKALSANSALTPG